MKYLLAFAGLLALAPFSTSVAQALPQPISPEPIAANLVNHAARDVFSGKVVGVVGGVVTLETTNGELISVTLSRFEVERFGAHLVGQNVTIENSLIRLVETSSANHVASRVRIDSSSVSMKKDSDVTVTPGVLPVPPLSVQSVIAPPPIGDPVPQRW